MHLGSADWYEPGPDAARRYADWVIRRRPIDPIPEVLCRRRKVILLDSGLSLAEKRCALAHAIAHLDLGHVPGSGRDSRRNERQADELAAQRLMPLPFLADALRWALGPEEVAHELDVTPRLVKVRLHSLSMGERNLMERLIEDVARWEDIA